jgi:ABC-type glycerol-3-phosphate transport system permease component
MVGVDELLRKRGLAELLKYSLVVISTVPMMLVYPFVQKHFVKGVMIGAIKG